MNNATAKLLLTNLILFTSSIGVASLTLEEGSYANRTQFDMHRGRVSLNFTYYGCDENPAGKKITLQASDDCELARNIKLGNDQGRTSRSGRVGVLIANYDEPEADANCEKRKQRLYTNYDWNKIYQQFQKKGCFPSYLAVRDGTGKKYRQTWKHMADKALCPLPMTRITKKGFPTEDHTFFALKANDKGFQIGEHTRFQYDHNKSRWCVQFRQQKPDCNTHPDPMPLAYYDENDKQYHLKAVVNLSPNGKASLKAIDKKYPTEKAIFNAQKNKEFVKTDSSKGRIDFHTWRKPNGVTRTILRSYETDGKYGNHQRAINFFPRNMFGIGVTHSWCPNEHCFAGVKNEKFKKFHDSKCSRNPKIDMTLGGSGSLCSSCMGFTAGECAIEENNVRDLKSKLLEDDNFRLDAETGEYKLGPAHDESLIKNYARIVEKPMNKGCHVGNVPAFEEIFDPGKAFRSEEGRSIDHKDKHL